MGFLGQDEHVFTVLVEAGTSLSLGTVSPSVGDGNNVSTALEGLDQNILLHFRQREPD